jgi:catechol 2,3-dioxygenase-like lactoylglutathione lyase family enzyme
VKPNALDHVALWVADRDAAAAFLIEALAMHEIDRTDSFTLVGGEARRGKLTLFEADGPRQRGVLGRIVLRVPDLTESRARLESLSVSTENGHDDSVTIEAPAGLPLALVGSAATDVIDLDHLVLRVPDPFSTVRELAALGLEADGDRVRVADKHLLLHTGQPNESERPLLNHVAFLVDSAQEAEDEARERGLEIDRVVDAPNTRAVFVWGPDRIQLEYVEHKPSFALA